MNDIERARARRETQPHDFSDPPVYLQPDSPRICKRCLGVTVLSAAAGEPCPEPTWTPAQREFMAEQRASLTRPRTGPNRQRVGARADMTKECICKPRDPRAYADDDGADFDCPHHGFKAIQWQTRP